MIIYQLLVVGIIINTKNISINMKSYKVANKLCIKY